jgi:hypothetical protein
VSPLLAVTVNAAMMPADVDKHKMDKAGTPTQASLYDSDVEFDVGHDVDEEEGDAIAGIAAANAPPAGARWRVRYACLCAFSSALNNG